MISALLSGGARNFSTGSILSLTRRCHFHNEETTLAFDKKATDGRVLGVTGGRSVYLQESRDAVGDALTLCSCL